MINKIYKRHTLQLAAIAKAFKCNIQLQHSSPRYLIVIVSVNGNPNQYKEITLAISKTKHEAGRDLLPRAYTKLTEACIELVFFKQGSLDI